MDPFTIVAEVLEGISSTVDGGVYNIVSHTELNPLALDSTAKALLESKAGTELQAIVNDAGQTIGYMAKGAAQAGNGAAADVSTYINVVAQEVEVTSEMAAETYIEATTGEVAQLTVGETVQTLSASSTGAGILSMEVGAAGAAIAPALGLLAGVGLYNIAPEFWTGVSNKLVDVGKTVGGKVQAIFGSDGTTSFDEDTIEIYKNEFLQAGMFSDIPQPFDLAAGGSITNVSDVAIGLQQIPQDWFSELTDTEQAHFNDVLNTVKNSGDPIVSGCSCMTILAYREAVSIVLFRVNHSAISYPIQASYPSGDYSIPMIEHMWQYYNGTITHSVQNRDYLFTRNKLNSLPLYNDTTWNENGRAWYNFGSDVEENGNVQPDATTPTIDPFPSTYPTWLPSDTIGNSDYYPVSLPTDDTTQPDSQTGDNDDPEKKDKLVNIIYITPEPDPTPTPQPDPDPSPDPEPEPEQEVIPQDDPIDPNPDPEDSDPTPTIPPLDSTDVSSMFCVYNPTDAQVNALGARLWTTNVIEQIKQMWNDPLDCIISFHKVYAAPTTGSSKNIMLGYYDSEVQALEVTNQFTEVDCGTIYVNERLRNATDYTPFTKAHLYLPFIGIVEIDITDIMAGSINVIYKVDMYTGTCNAMVMCQRSPDMVNKQMLYSFAGNAAQQLPLTSANHQGRVSALLGLAGAGVAVASGGGVGLAAGAVTAAHSLTQEMVHVQHSGGLSANAGIMAPRKPALILSRQSGYDANGYNAFYGYPANKSVYLSNVSGYVRVKNINLRTGATAAENDLILAALHDGVII